MSPSWIPLHVHSQYSILNSTMGVEDIAAIASSMGMPACAITDEGNMYGAIEFYKACQNLKIKPISGGLAVLLLVPLWSIKANPKYTTAEPVEEKQTA